MPTRCCAVLQLRPTGEPLPGEIAPAYSCFGSDLVDTGSRCRTAHTAFATQIQGETQFGRGDAVHSLPVGIKFDFGVVERLVGCVGSRSGGGERGLRQRGGGMLLPGASQGLSQRRRRKEAVTGVAVTGKARLARSQPTPIIATTRLSGVAKNKSIENFL